MISYSNISHIMLKQDINIFSRILSLNISLNLLHQSHYYKNLSFSVSFTSVAQNLYEIYPVSASRMRQSHSHLPSHSLIFLLRYHSSVIFIIMKSLVKIPIFSRKKELFHHSVLPSSHYLQTYIDNNHPHLITLEYHCSIS